MGASGGAHNGLPCRSCDGSRPVPAILEVGRPPLAVTLEKDEDEPGTYMAFCPELGQEIYARERNIGRIRAEAMDVAVVALRILREWPLVREGVIEAVRVGV